MLYAQNQQVKSNVQYIREQLLSKIAFLLALPELQATSDLNIVLPDVNSSIGDKRLQFWNNLLAEVALAEHKKVFAIGDVKNVVVPEESFVVNSTIEYWNLGLSKLKDGKYLQNFRAGIQVQFINLKHEVLVNRLLTIEDSRVIANKRTVELIQSSQNGFRHTMPKEKFHYSDFAQTFLVAGAVVGSVLLLYHMRSK